MKARAVWIYGLRTLTIGAISFGVMSLSASGNPQGSGERRDNEGAKSGERPVMLLDKLPGAMAIGRDRAAESGWIFFGGVLFVGFLVPLYAGLKCWRFAPSFSRRTGRTSCFVGADTRFCRSGHVAQVHRAGDC